MSSASTEAALRERVRQQAVVAELGRRALVGETVEELMPFVAEATAGALGVEFANVLEWKRAEDMLCLRAAFGWPGRVGEDRIPAGPENQAGYTLRSSEPAVVADHEREDRFVRPPLLASYGVRSGISVVIPGSDVEHGPYGVLQAYSTRRRAFTADDVAFMQGAAHVLAAAIARQQTERALRESEARSRAILNTTVDGIITIDVQGRIESFNPAAEKIFGHTADEVIGQRIDVLMPEPYRSEHDGYMRSYLETGRRKIIGIGREVTGLRRDGTTFPMDLAVSEVQLGERIIFTGIIRDISERRGLEQEVLRVTEEERRRIGQDLHDGLGQQLTGTALIAQNLARILGREEHPAAETAREITDLIKEADQMARGLARGLVPVDVGAGGLAAALQRLADNAARLFGIACTLETTGVARVRDATVATHLFRIAQEAVSNAVRHGRARTVTIQLAAGEEQLRVRVRDDGSGFTEDDLQRPGRSETRGMGVRIMNYRARIIGGSLEIRRGARGGTVVTCTLPDSTDSPAFREGPAAAHATS